jgi:hypothetical protein
MALYFLREFEISTPQSSTHFFPTGNRDVLEIVVHKIIRVSDVIASNILDSDHLPLIFHILDHIKIRNLSEPIENFTDCDRFQIVAWLLISLRIETNLWVQAHKAACDFTASIASAYRLATSIITLSDINNGIPGLD